jgi:hypothetical protein
VSGKFGFQNARCNNNKNIVKYYQLKRQCKFQTTALHYSHLPAAKRPKTDLRLLNFEFSISHTITHTPGRTPLNERSPRLRCHYLHNTQQTQDTNIHALSGVRSLDPKNEAASDLRLRPRGNRHRLAVSVVSAY